MERSPDEETENLLRSLVSRVPKLTQRSIFCGGCFQAVATAWPQARPPSFGTRVSRCYRVLLSTICVPHREWYAHGRRDAAMLHFHHRYKRVEEHQRNSVVARPTPTAFEHWTTRRQQKSGCWCPATSMRWTTCSPSFGLSALHPSASPKISLALSGFCATTVAASCSAIQYILPLTAVLENATQMHSYDGRTRERPVESTTADAAGPSAASSASSIALAQAGSL